VLSGWKLVAMNTDLPSPIPPARRRAGGGDVNPPLTPFLDLTTMKKVKRILVAVAGVKRSCTS
jgi:hypothetical protein